MSVREMLEATGHAAGSIKRWTCDGCGECTPIGGAELSTMKLYHGDVESDNPLGINAVDLCDDCAADIPAAEAHYEANAEQMREQEQEQEEQEEEE